MKINSLNCWEVFTNQQHDCNNNNVQRLGEIRKKYFFKKLNYYEIYCIFDNKFEI